MDRREFSLSLLSAISAIALQARGQQRPRVNGRRLNAHLTELAQFGKTPEGETNRPAYSDADLEARRYVMQLMNDARLQTRTCA